MGANFEFNYSFKSCLVYLSNLLMTFCIREIAAVFSQSYCIWDFFWHIADSNENSKLPLNHYCPLVD